MDEERVHTVHLVCYTPEFMTTSTNMPDNSVSSVSFNHVSASGVDLEMGWCHNHRNISIVKGTVHPQKLFFKYVMLRTVTKTSTIIITKYT